MTKIWAHEKTLDTACPQLAKEFDLSANSDLTPADLKPHSNRKVAWICGKGHKWLATVGNRTNGKGCPYCSGRLPVKGENDLVTLDPELAKEWSDRNGDLKPSDVSPRSERKVWWECPAGHEWQARVCKRTEGKGCPYCAHRKVLPEDSLTATHPQIASEFDVAKNGCSPTEICAGSNRVMWWKCRYGHSWLSVVRLRTRTTRPGLCPYCTGKKALPGETDFGTMRPYLAKEWDGEKNHVDPATITLHSNKVFWWKCRNGHPSYLASVNSRAGGRGCPYCAGKRKIPD